MLFFFLGVCGESLIIHLEFGKRGRHVGKRGRRVATM